SWNQRTGQRYQSGFGAGSYTISIGWGTVLVHHYRGPSNRYAVMGQPVRAETVADRDVLEVAQEFPKFSEDILLDVETLIGQIASSRSPPRITRGDQPFAPVLQPRVSRLTWSSGTTRSVPRLARK